MEALERDVQTLEKDVATSEKLIGSNLRNTAVLQVQQVEHQDRIKVTEKAIDKIGSRLTRLEIALAVLIAVTASPKLGGPSLPQFTTSVLHYLT